MEGGLLYIRHLICADIVAGVFEHLLGFCECDPHGFLPGGWELEVAGFGVAFFFEDVGESDVLRAFLQLADDEGDEFFAEGEDFVVVVYYGHLPVEACELYLLSMPMLHKWKGKVPL